MYHFYGFKVVSVIHMQIQANIWDLMKYKHDRATEPLTHILLQRSNANFVFPVAIHIIDMSVSFWILQMLARSYCNWPSDSGLQTIRIM